MMQKEVNKVTLKELWKNMVLNYSDTPSLFPMDLLKKKIKQLNKIVDEMTDEEVVIESIEIQNFINSFTEVQK